MAEKIWDAKESGTLDDLRKDHAREMPGKRKWSIKIPQVHEDILQMTGQNLIKWMRSQGHAVKYALKREEVIDQIRKSGILEKMSQHGSVGKEDNE